MRTALRMTTTTTTATQRSKTLEEYDKFPLSLLSMQYTNHQNLKTPTPSPGIRNEYQEKSIHQRAYLYPQPQKGRKRNMKEEVGRALTSFEGSTARGSVILGLLDLDLYIVRNRIQKRDTGLRRQFSACCICSIHEGLVRC